MPTVQVGKVGSIFRQGKEGETMKGRLSAEQIEAAVDWWMNVLMNPKFDTLGASRHRREPDRATEFSEILVTVTNRQSPPVPDNIKKFGDCLRKTLSEIDGHFRGLFVDYHPDIILAECARESGLYEVGSISVFPWKTKMWFEKGGVQVSYGYGAQDQELCGTVRANG